MRRLYHIPGVNRAWLLMTIFFIIALFGYWHRFVTNGQLELWRVLLGCLLIADLLLLLVPARDQAFSRPTRLGDRMWVFGTDILLFAFVFTSLPDLGQILSNRHPFLFALSGLTLAGGLIVSVFKSNGRWLREPPRSILARRGGGFVIRFDSAEQAGEIIDAIQSLPGVQLVQSSQDMSATEWILPADSLAAQALLEFAKKYDFDFVSNPPKSVSLAQLKDERSRGK